MIKKLLGTLCLLFLLIGIVSAVDMNYTSDTLNVDENNHDEIVKIYDGEILKEDQKSSVTIKFVNANQQRRFLGNRYGKIQ